MKFMISLLVVAYLLWFPLVANYNNVIGEPVSITVTPPAPPPVSCGGLCTPTLAPTPTEECYQCGPYPTLEINSFNQYLPFVGN